MLNTVTEAESGGRACRDLISTGSISGGSYQLALQQLTDSALPTGAFTHSLGFESYIESGVVRDEGSGGVLLIFFLCLVLLGVCAFFLGGFGCFFFAF